ncbi:hypothetical protein LUZ61_020974 [Rhynchospora tenuis]|uniref:Splicing factor 3A subunit 1 n=1 Tax=Rhynchospora tenuis TaxID=198213 RepID=A0AAD5ZE04_9POAL|nr:hypothetical protein LUZ61_020974 [Rhynchospora tenuis]
MSMAAPILPLPAPPLRNDNDKDKDKDNASPTEEEPSAPAPAPVATHTRTIGIIYPPPDIKAIVEKTAQYVAKNGSDFERQILAKNAGNPKFNFLIPSDPYHAYYQSRVSTHALHALQSTDADADAPPSQPDSASKPPAADSTNDEFRAPPPKKILDPPPSEQYTVRLPEGITGEELDVIKLTAQFVARNGKSFMDKLIKRVDLSSPQFHFLRPTHSMYTFFTSLADAYSKVLMPDKGLTDKLRDTSADLTVVLERCLHRLEWDKSQEQERQRAEDEIEQERMHMAMIDWHDFIVVETIEFAEEEDQDLPLPMTLEDVIRRSKLPALDEPDLLPIDAAAAEPGKEMDIDMDDEEIQLVQEGMRAAQLDDTNNNNNNTHATADNMSDEPMRIVKNWKRPEERLPPERDPTKFVVSPITGELIPINEMAEHMRISLIDPKYKEQKDRMMAKIKETTLAADDEISRNIVGLARTRPDIFGTTEEEVSNAVKAEIEKKNDEQPKQVIWDGHSGSIGRTASQALSQNMQTEELANTGSNNLPGPAAPPPRPNIPTLRPLPPPPGLALNMPRIPTPAGSYPAPPASTAIPGPPQMIPSMRPPVQPIPGQPHSMMMARPGMPQMVPPPPGSQFTPVVPPPRPFMPVGMAAPSLPNMAMASTPAPPPPLPLGVPPPPPPEEVPPPLPDEPEPKRQKLDDSSLVPEDQFLAQHPGSARILVAVPNLEEGNLKGQVLEISVQSLSETISSLKEKIAGEVQLPANKQKISGKAGFLKDNHSLAYYNITPGEALTLALRERGGRKK